MMTLNVVHRITGSCTGMRWQAQKSPLWEVWGQHASRRQFWIKYRLEQMMTPLNVVHRITASCTGMRWQAQKSPLWDRMNRPSLHLKNWFLASQFYQNRESFTRRCSLHSPNLPYLLTFPLQAAKRFALVVLLTIILPVREILKAWSATKFLKRLQVMSSGPR